MNPTEEQLIQTNPESWAAITDRYLSQRLAQSAEVTKATDVGRPQIFSQILGMSIRPVVAPMVRDGQMQMLMQENLQQINIPNIQAIPYNRVYTAPNTAVAIAAENARQRNVTGQLVGAEAPAALSVGGLITLQRGA